MWGPPNYGTHWHDNSHYPHQYQNQNTEYISEMAKQWAQYRQVSINAQNSNYSQPPPPPPPPPPEPFTSQYSMHSSLSQHQQYQPPINQPPPIMSYPYLECPPQPAPPPPMIQHPQCVHRPPVKVLFPSAQNTEINEKLEEPIYENHQHDYAIPAHLKSTFQQAYSDTKIWNDIQSRNPGLPETNIAYSTEKTKALPSWLRQELEKIERKKKEKESESSLKVQNDLEVHKQLSPEQDSPEAGDTNIILDSMGKDHKSEVKLNLKGFDPDDETHLVVTSHEEFLKRWNDLSESERASQTTSLVRRFLTTALLDVTSELFTELAHDVYNNAKTSKKAQLKPLVNVDPGLSSLVAYDTDSENDGSHSSDKCETVNQRTKPTIESPKRKEKTETKPKRDSKSKKRSRSRSRKRSRSSSRRRHRSKSPRDRKSSKKHSRHRRSRSRSRRNNKHTRDRS